LRDEPLATARFLAILPNFHLKLPRGHPCLRTLRVELPDIRMPIAVITLKNRTLSPIAQLFIDHVRALTKPRDKIGT
jgi:DNA-binding transcriptional LysR family regulator